MGDEQDTSEDASVKHRGTTNAELDESLTRILTSLERHVDPGYERFFRCSGGCEDTGWVVVDDGVGSSGKRVRAAVVRRCSVCGGRSSKRATEVTGGSFT